MRGITNLSSGKMGFAIARAAREAGAEVTLVAGPGDLPTPRGVQRIDVQSAQEMLEATLRQAAAADVFVATAAVADWRPAPHSEQKIKKDGRASRRSSPSSRTPTSWPRSRSRREPRRARCSASALRPRAKTSRAMPGQARAQGHSAAGRQHRPADLRRGPQRLLLVDAQRRYANCRAPPSSTLARELVAEIAARGPHTSRPNSMKIDVKILDPRMADQLPAMQRPAAPASTCAPASTSPLTLEPNGWQLVGTGIAIWLARPRLCGDDPAALGAGPQARHRAGQPGRPDRQRLPGPADGQRLEPQRRRRSPCSRWSGWPSW